jgi:hypothetical protein
MLQATSLIVPKMHLPVLGALMACFWCPVASIALKLLDVEKAACMSMC